jgi:hypothetical protein
MPRTDRRKCAGCDKTIDGGVIHGCSNDLFRFFISARSLKRIERSDDACRKCRSKFDNWLRKNREEFGDLRFQEDVGYGSVSPIEWSVGWKSLNISIVGSRKSGAIYAD